MVVATCEIFYATDHSIDICLAFQDYLNVSTNKFGDFHPNVKHGMTLIQMGMIKDDGIILT